MNDPSPNSSPHERIPRDEAPNSQTASVAARPTPPQAGRSAFSDSKAAGATSSMVARTRKIAVWTGLLVAVGAGGFGAFSVSQRDPGRTSAPTARSAPVQGSSGSAEPGSLGSAVPGSLPVAETPGRLTPDTGPNQPQGTGAVQPPGDRATTTTDDMPEVGGPSGGPAVITTPEGCDAGYIGVCIPRPPTRITCDQISETNFQVAGDDAQGLDPDGDGTACENHNNQPNPNRTPEEDKEFGKVD